MTTSETFYYPNRMGRIVLLSMEEVMGRNGVNAILKLSSLSSLMDAYPDDTTKLAFPFKTISNLTDTLEQAYGPHGGRGLALRIGRACFHYGVPQYGTQLGLTKMAFRPFAAPDKSKCGRQGSPLNYSITLPISVYA